MVTKTIYEERILREIQDLPESAQEKLEKLIRFFKQELVTAQPEPDEKMKKLLSVFGTWEDDRTVDDQIKDIYESRKSVQDRVPLK